MVRKVNSACDWGSGMSAWDRPSLKPGAARKEGALPRSSEERSGRSRWRWSPGHSWRDTRGNPCWPRRYLRWRREGVIVGKHILWSRPGWDGGCREGGCGPHRHRNEGRPRCGAPHCGWAARRVHTGHRSALWSGAVAAGVLEPSIIDRWGHRRGHSAGADVPNDVERFLECMVHAQHIVPPLSLLS